MNILLLMMGGSGTRFGAEIPKQYTEIDGRPIFAYILSAYDTHPSIDRIIIVSHPDWKSFVTDWVNRCGAKKVYSVVIGGATRSESVLNGLECASAFACSSDVVLMHDATHPYMDYDGVNEVIDGVNKYGGATLGACQYDTCYSIDTDNKIRAVMPRQELISGASPEGFRFGDIYSIYKNAPREELERMTSAGAIALAHNIPMIVVPTQIINLKITYPQDMGLFKLLVHSYFFKSEV